jgi:radical SAM protein with 4Fe4S-binding SPASM domain
MRIQGAELRSKKRLDLGRAAPLPGPISMYIEPTNACNIRCRFCPTGDQALIKQVGRKTGTMTQETWDRIAESLFDLPPIKIINFYKDGEPLVNKNLAKWARELKNMQVAEKIYIKTNGLLLDPANTAALAPNFDMIGISVIAPSAEGYKRLAGVSMDYEKFKATIANLYRRRQGTLYIKMAIVDHTPEDIEKFYSDFEGISDYIAVENLHGWTRTDLKDFTLGHQDNKTFDGVPNVKRLVCAWPLYQMAINWNGTVQPCNEDWSWVNIMGNVNQESISKIWNGDKFVNFRKMQLNGLRFGNKACGSCWQMMSQLDDVDQARTAILARMH